MNGQRWTIAVLASALTWACGEPAAGPDGAPAPINAATSNWDSQILSIDHYVPHTSTNPANAGETVQLFVRERVKDTARGDADVVLFVHGGSVPSVPAFDLGFEHYSWLAWLAQAGFDVFAMDLTGYGRSPRPQMADPCNVNPAQQSLLIPRNMPAACPATYPFRLATSQSEWDELDRVVDYLRALRNVERVSLVAWSAGAQRVGPYVARHPEKLKYVLFDAPVFTPSSPTNPPATLPVPGFPMTLQTRADLYRLRWDPEVQCADQIEDGVRDAIWDEAMANDDVGRTWGPPEGVMRVPTRTVWGWNTSAANLISVPALIIVGEHDGFLTAGQNLYRDLGTARKVFVKVACGSHFMPWERQHKVLHHVSKNWLKDGNLEGYEQGEFYVDTEGVIHKQ